MLGFFSFSRFSRCGSSFLERLMLLRPLRMSLLGALCGSLLSALVRLLRLLVCTLRRPLLRLSVLRRSLLSALVRLLLLMCALRRPLLRLSALCGSLLGLAALCRPLLGLAALCGSLLGLAALCRSLLLGLTALCRPLLRRLAALRRPLLRRLAALRRPLLLAALCRSLLLGLTALCRPLLRRYILHRPLLRRLCHSSGLIDSVRLLCVMLCGMLLRMLSLIRVCRLLLRLRLYRWFCCFRFRADARVRCSLNDHLNFFLIFICFGFFRCNFDNLCLGATFSAQYCVPDRDHIHIG